MPLLDTPVISPVIVGRAHELATLERALQSAKQGSGRFLVITGEAGVGKSRLLHEMGTRANRDGFRVLRGQCFEQDRAYPYAPLIDALRAFFSRQSTATVQDLLGPLAAEVVKLLPELGLTLPQLQPTPTLDPEAEKRRLFEALAQVCTRLATAQPLLIILEDLHWSDETTREFLRVMARRLSAHPILLLVSYRREDAPAHLTHGLAQLERERLLEEIGLSRLTRDEVAVMLRAIFAMPRPPRVQLVDALYALSDGNPFFVEETLKSLIATGEIAPMADAWDDKPIQVLQVPRSIQDMLRQRTTQLSSAARQVLSLAAVMGQRFDFVLLQQLTHLDERDLLHALKELITGQLVVEASNEQFAFRHALTREAIYQGMLARECMLLHRTMAETLEQSSTARFADLSYHFYEAGEWRKALDHAQRAGEQAQQLYAPRAALEHFTRALDAARKLSLPPPPGLYRALGLAYQTLGDFEAARANYEQMLQMASITADRRAGWQALLDLGTLWSGRDYGQTGEYYRRALELARTLDDAATVGDSLNRLGNWYVNVGQPHAGLHYHTEALTIFEKLTHRRGMAQTLDLLGTACYLGCDVLKGTRYYERAIPLFRELGDRHGLMSSLAQFTLRAIPNSITATGTLDEAVRDGEEALSIAREIDSREGEALALCQLGQCLVMRGDSARALRLLQQALSSAQALQHYPWLTFAHQALGLAYADLLALTTAQQHFAQALSLAQTMGLPMWIRFEASFLAQTHVAQHTLDQAQALLDSALGPFPAQLIDGEGPPLLLGDRLAWFVRAELALARGNPDLALRIVDWMAASALSVEPNGGRNSLLMSKLRGEALILTKQFTAAEVALQNAQQTAFTLGARPLLWRIHRLLGRLYQAQSRRAEAEREFGEARAIIETLAVNAPDADVSAQFLRSANAMLPRARTLSPRQSAKQAFGGLTTREREVAAMIAQGKSNREIAETLVVTERTVEAHVGNILSKLGFTSRAQVAVWAVEKGL